MSARHSLQSSDRYVCGPSVAVVCAVALVDPVNLCQPRLETAAFDSQGSFLNGVCVRHIRPLSTPKPCGVLLPGYGASMHRPVPAGTSQTGVRTRAVHPSSEWQSPCLTPLLLPSLLFRELCSFSVQYLATFCIVVCFGASHPATDRLDAHTVATTCSPTWSHQTPATHRLRGW